RHHLVILSFPTRRSSDLIKTYVSEFIQLLKMLGNNPAENLTPDQLRAYILYCIDRLKLSESLMHSRLNAIKFYYEQVLKREKFIDRKSTRLNSSHEKISY